MLFHNTLLGVFIFGPSEKLPKEWSASVAKAKDKANKLANKLVALSTDTHVIVGRLSKVSVEKFWKLNYPHCKLVLDKALKFGMDGRQQSKLAESQAFFINKPQSIMTMIELREAHPRIFSQVHEDDFSKT